MLSGYGKHKKIANGKQLFLPPPLPSDPSTWRTQDQDSDFDTKLLQALRRLETFLWIWTSYQKGKGPNIKVKFGFCYQKSVTSWGKKPTWMGMSGRNGGIQQSLQETKSGDNFRINFHYPHQAKGLKVGIKSWLDFSVPHRIQKVLMERTEIHYTWFLEGEFKTSAIKASSMRCTSLCREMSSLIFAHHSRAAPSQTFLNEVISFNF